MLSTPGFKAFDIGQLVRSLLTADGAGPTISIGSFALALDDVDHGGKYSNSPGVPDPRQILAHQLVVRMDETGACECVGENVLFPAVADRQQRLLETNLRFFAGEVAGNHLGFEFCRHAVPRFDHKSKQID